MAKQNFTSKVRADSRKAYEKVKTGDADISVDDRVRMAKERAKGVKTLAEELAEKYAESNGSNQRERG